MEPKVPLENTNPIAESPAQQPMPATPVASHIQPDPRPPITQLDHQPRHHKRVMMIVTIIVVVILIAIALGYYLGTAAPKHTW
jgi:hypothetical protein